MVKYEISKDKSNKAYEVISRAKDSGKVRKGANEATKAIERSQAVLIAMAEDTAPKEIIAHLPGLCEEKGIPYISVPKKEELGKAAGLTVPTTAVAVADAGDAKKLLEELVKSGEKKEKKEEKPDEEKKVEGGKVEGSKKEEKPVKKKEEPKPEGEKAGKPESTKQEPKAEEKPEKKEKPKAEEKPEKKEKPKAEKKE